MNIYPSTAAAPASRSFAFSSGAPVVVLVHGGGWHRQSVYTLTEIARESRSLQAAGFTVFAIAYRQDDADNARIPDGAAGRDRGRQLGARARGQLRRRPQPARARRRLGWRTPRRYRRRATRRSREPGRRQGASSRSVARCNFAQITAAFRNGTITSEVIQDSPFTWRSAGGARRAARLGRRMVARRCTAPRASCPRWLIFNSESTAADARSRRPR